MGVIVLVDNELHRGNDAAVRAGGISIFLADGLEGIFHDFQG
jgi:hypothetical protein